MEQLEPDQKYICFPSLTTISFLNKVPLGSQDQAGLCLSMQPLF